MLKSYWKSAFRNLWKNKGFSAINIMGLAIGLATCLLILLYVMDERSFDAYNLKAGRIYRIDNQMKVGDNQFDAAQAGPVMGPVFARDFPQVEQWVRFRHRGGFLVKKGNEHFKEDKVIYADSSLFDVFTLPFIAGDAGSALKEPHSLVITESTARKYFNRTDVVGQSLLINDQTNYKITGVIKDVPAQSHFNYDFFAAMSELDDSRVDTWMSQNFNTYVLLKPGVDAKSLEKRFNEALERYAEPEFKSAVNLSMADLKKGGGYCYTKSLAKELAPAGIRVNIVTPGAIITPGGDEGRKQLATAFGITVEQLFKAIPLEGRPGTAENMAEMIAFLVSDRASYITGHNHFVSGGQGELA